MSDAQKFSTVGNVIVYDTKGPWQSKSGGELSVLMSLDLKQIEEFQTFNNPEFGKIFDKTGINIRGLRVYNVANIPNDSTGAMEFHLARTEIVNVLLGRVLWTCEDVYGDIKEFSIGPAQSLIVPPGVMHTYKALEDNTRLQVVCNTLFYPEEPETHDSYSFNDFRLLQSKFSK